MSTLACRLCEEPRYYNSKYCKSHYYQHLKDLKKEKAENKKAKHQLTKKYQESVKKILHRKAWKLISEFVRQNGKDEFGNNCCYTCGVIKPWKELQCGHRHHAKLDFDVRNLKPQCVRCNHHLSGNLGEYENRLVNDYGVDWVNKLRADAFQHQGYSIEDLKSIIQKNVQ